MTVPKTATSLALLTAICLLACPLAARAAPDEPAYVGVVSMASDGSIRVKWIDKDYGPALKIKPGDPNYESYRTEYGELKPGAAILMPYVVGSVRMAEDGSLEYRMRSLGPGPIAETSGRVKPGDPGYEHWLSQGGGLKPGEGKPIFGYGLKPRPVDPKSAR